MTGPNHPERRSLGAAAAFTVLMALGTLAGLAPLGAGHGSSPDGQSAGWDTYWGPQTDDQFFPPGTDDLSGAPWKCRSMQSMLGTQASPEPTDDQFNKYVTVDAVEYIHGSGTTRYPQAGAVRAYHFQQPVGIGTPETNVSPMVLEGPADGAKAPLSSDGWFLINMGTAVVDQDGYDLRFYMGASGPAHLCVYGTADSTIRASTLYTFIGSGFIDPTEAGVPYDLSYYYTPFTKATPSTADNGGVLRHLLVQASPEKHPFMTADFGYTPFDPGASLPNRFTRVRFKEDASIYGHQLHYAEGPVLTGTQWDEITQWSWTYEDPFPARFGEPDFPKFCGLSLDKYRQNVDQNKDGATSEHKWCLPSNPEWLHTAWNAGTEQMEPVYHKWNPTTQQMEPGTPTNPPLPECDVDQPTDVNPPTNAPCGLEEHVHPAEPFEVCMTALTSGDPGSTPALSRTFCRDVTVYDIPPQPKFTWKLDPSLVATAKMFDISKDFDDGFVALREWDFDYDGVNFQADPVNGAGKAIDKDEAKDPAKRDPVFSFVDAAGNPIPGTHLVALRVTDSITEPWGRSEIFVDKIIIHPEKVRPPLLDPIHDVVVPAGDPVQVQVAATDADGDLLTFTVTGLPSDAVWDPEGLTIHWTAGPPGIYGPVRVSVTDGRFVTSDTFRIVVYDLGSENDNEGGSLGGDADHDGVRDLADNCPAVDNPDQASLEPNGPGIACDPRLDDEAESQDDEDDGQTENPPPVDLCPGLAGAQGTDLDEDGRGDACDDDADGDLIPESAHGVARVDNCPRTPNPEQVDTDNDGVGDVCQRGARLLNNATVGALGTGGDGSATPQDTKITQSQVRDVGPDGPRMVLLSLAVMAATALVAFQTIRWSRRRGGPQPSPEGHAQTEPRP